MVVVTGSTADWADVAGLTRPSLAAWCARHSYPLQVTNLNNLDRPASWGKVPALLAALCASRQALWVDADVLVAPDAPAFPHVTWHGLVEHRVGEGDVPNCGVWAVSTRFVPFLYRVWEDAAAIHHRWWEQAAVIRLMGYDPDALPVRKVGPGQIPATKYLDPRWNSTPAHPTPGAWMRHASGIGNRVEVLQAWKADWNGEKPD